MSQAKNQSIMRRVALAWHGAKRQFAIARRHARENEERMRTEVELLMDQVAAEGFDPDSPLGYAMVAELIKARLPERDEYSERTKDTAF